MRLIDHPAARAEFLEAVRFYRRSGPAAAERFVTETARAIEAIKEHPGRWRLFKADVRCCRLAGFPYKILYRATAGSLKVFAYKHDRRHPDYWLGRLND